MCEQLTLRRVLLIPHLEQVQQGPAASAQVLTGLLSPSTLAFLAGRLLWGRCPALRTVLWPPPRVPVAHACL